MREIEGEREGKRERGVQEMERDRESEVERTGEERKRMSDQK